MSFKVKLNSINLNCAPMVTEGFNGESNLIGYMCKSSNMREIEGFENVENYNNNKPYVVGDVVSYQGSVFKMIEGAGPPGYAPDREGDRLWELVSGPGNRVHPGNEPPAYDNNKPYVVGNVVSYQGSVFKMVEGAGPAGYAPDREGDRLWELVSGPGNLVHPGKTVKAAQPVQQARSVQQAGNGQQAGRINIVEASYGINCNNSLRGNRTELFKGLMDGKQKVEYKFDYTKTGGDPAEGCGKILEVKFHCGDNNLQKLVVPAEAGYNGAVNIDCSKFANEQVQQQPVQVVQAQAQAQSSSSGLAKYVRLGGGNDWINLSQLVVKDSNGVNVSRGRPTTSSGVGAGGEEGNAVDGDEQPRHHPRGYHSSSNKDAFFQVTLDNPTNVSSVTVYGRNDFGGRMAGHKISLLDSNNKVIFTSNDLNSELKQVINITGNSDSSSKKSGSVKYVKLGGGNDWINLSQLVVFDSNGGNIAKGRPTTSSGVGFDGREEKAVDGSEQPRGHPNEYHSSSDKNAFFQVELEKPSIVSSVVVYNRSDCCSDRMGNGHKIYLLDSNKQVLFESNKLNGELKQVIDIPKLNESFTGVNYNDIFYSAFGKIDDSY